MKRESLLPAAVAVCGCAALLTGCAIMGEIHFTKGLEASLGRPADDLLTVIGFPNDEQVIDGRRFLIYRNRYVQTQTQQNYYSGNRDTTYVDAQCEIRFLVDADSVVRAYQWYGNTAGCQRYWGIGRLAK